MKRELGGARSSKIFLSGAPVEVRKSGYWLAPGGIGGKVYLGATRVEALASLEYRRQQHAEKAPQAAKALGPRALKMRTYYSAAARARKFGRAMMSIEEYEAIWERSGGKCEISGIEFNNEKLSASHSKRPWAPSLDRIDNTRGYEADNCRLVCTAVNLALNEFGEAGLRKIAWAIYRRGWDR